MNKKLRVYIFLLFVFAQGEGMSQDPVFVDKEGVLRWTKDKKEASFFGVNYTVPFAYGYRSHKALGKDLKKSIDEDVYHMSRLGLDGFRVHMWDVEITDSTGKLLQNEHLDLFDYLLFKLEEQNIYSLITPIAFWGNGYPERDEKTIGFSSVYGKDQSVVKEVAIAAQENYLRQLMNHVNPYTKKTYREDPFIIAVEINNEPHHSGPKERTTEYVNRLAAAIRSTGWTKPVYYNISESPWYADAVAKSGVQGHSFQWYPSGLVANHEQKGNFLPHVDRYVIPFDSVPEYRKKARMVYEFDAADILQSNMYPAIARSYRTAGFQWATQFAYDPVATAYGNTEYQTHYLNLAYTPAKAISLLIASKVFHRLPRLKDYGAYPADTLFDVFRVSYKNQLSEMNSDEEFYYTNTTNSRPVNLSQLKHIAGVGSSPLIQYEGTGAYFLDKISEGVWRLELMPDIIQIRDPFERASPKKEVTRIQWGGNNFTIGFNSILKPGFSVFPLNNSYTEPDKANQKFSGPTGPSLTFNARPGVYILHNSGISLDNMRFKEPAFVAPAPYSEELFVAHSPPVEVSANKPFFIRAKVAGLNADDKISLELRAVPRWRTIPMEKKNAGEYVAEIPADAVVPGLMNYRIIVQKANNDTYVFPGNVKGNPFAWDNTSNETFQTIVASPAGAFELFNTNTDRNNLIQYNTDWRNNSVKIIPGSRTTQLAVQLLAKALNKNPIMAWQFFAGDKIKGRESELGSFKFLVIKCRSENISFAKILLVSKDAVVFSSNLVAGAEWDIVRIPLQNLKPDSLLLLPRPYPGFLPLWFQSSGKGAFSLAEVETIQLLLEGRKGRKDELKKEEDFAIESIWLEK